MSTKKTNIKTESDRASDQDPGFGEGGFVRIPDPDNPWVMLTISTAIAIEPTLQSDQSVYIATQSAGVGYVVRLLADGQIDTTFGDSGYAAVPRGDPQRHVPLSITHFVFDESGYITCFGIVDGLFGGGLYIVPGACRFTSAGVLDQNFGEEGLAIYVLGPKAGKLSSHPGRSATARLHARSSDQAETRPGRFLNPPRATRLADGKILFLANIYDRDVREHVASYLARINRDGSLDKDFGENGVVLLTDPANGGVVNGGNYAIDRRGGITVSGHIGVRPWGPGIVARYDAEGRPERGFGEFGVVRVTEPSFPSADQQSNSIIVQDDGGVIAAFTLFGSGDDSVTAVIKMRSSGDNDPGFNNGKYAILDYGPTRDPVWDMAIDDANRIVLVGMRSFTEDGAVTTRGRISRLMPHGMLDEGFGVDGTVVYENFSMLKAVGIQNRVNIIAVTQDRNTGYEYVVVRIFG